MDESLDAPTRAPEPQAAETQAAQTISRFKWIGWSSLFLALVQSVCTIFVALSGLRLLIGAAAFGTAVGVMKFAAPVTANLSLSGMSSDEPYTTTWALLEFSGRTQTTLLCPLAMPTQTDRRAF